MKKLLVLFFLIGVSASATTDENAMGTYSHSSKSFSLRFEWKIDGIHNLVVNGKRHTGVLAINSHGRFGSTGVYEISFPGEQNRSRSIQLFVLFDEKERVRRAAAYYIESTTISGNGTDWKLGPTRLLEFQFKAAPPQ